jgi:hypothetical protein
MYIYIWLLSGKNEWCPNGFEVVAAKCLIGPNAWFPTAVFLVSKMDRDHSNSFPKLLIGLYPRGSAISTREYQ